MIDLGSFKTAYDMAKELVNLHDSVSRQGKVNELQKQISDALQAALAESEERQKLADAVRELKERIAQLESWNAEKSRYERCEVAPGVIVFVLKLAERGSEPFHMLCPRCFHDGKISELQATAHTANGRRVHACPRCEAEYNAGHASKGYWSHSRHDIEPTS